MLKQIKNTYIIAIIIKLDRLSAVRVVGIAAGVGGVLCILLPEASLPEGSSWIWMVIALSVPLSFAIVAILLICNFAIVLFCYFAILLVCYTHMRSA